MEGILRGRGETRYVEMGELASLDNEVFSDGDLVFDGDQLKRLDNVLDFFNVEPNAGVGDALSGYRHWWLGACQSDNNSGVKILVAGC